MLGGFHDWEVMAHNADEVLDKHNKLIGINLRHPERKTGIC
jgi:hypothetical protein